MLSVYTVVQGSNNVIYNATLMTLEMKLQGTVKLLKFRNVFQWYDTLGTPKMYSDTHFIALYDSSR